MSYMRCVLALLSRLAQGVCTTNKVTDQVTRGCKFRAMFELQEPSLLPYRTVLARL